MDKQPLKKEEEEREKIGKLSSTPTRKQLLETLDHLINEMDHLPPSAMTAPVTHYDYCSLLMLLSSFLRAEMSADS